MRKGFSIHIGLNHVDPNHYRDKNGQPWSGMLAGCGNDACDMETLVHPLGYKTQVLLNEQATVHAVTAALQQAAAELQPGDILLLTYAGHGGQVPDLNSDEPTDNLDETWCLFDRQLVDDELFQLWACFAQGVRILMISDSCHSGSVARDPLFSAVLANTPGARVRLMPPDVQDRTYRLHEQEYDDVQQNTPDGDRLIVAATVILISGCQDNQVSSDGIDNGLFTSALKKVWDGGNFRSSLRRFHKDIVAQMPLWQAPNFLVVGAPNPAFEQQVPFQIGD